MPVHPSDDVRGILLMAAAPSALTYVRVCIYVFRERERERERERRRETLYQ